MTRGFGLGEGTLLGGKIKIKIKIRASGGGGD